MGQRWKITIHQCSQNGGREAGGGDNKCPESPRSSVKTFEQGHPQWRVVGMKNCVHARIFHPGIWNSSLFVATNKDTATIFVVARIIKNRAEGAVYTYNFIH